MALVLCTAGAMAQTTTNTIRFTFARTGTGLTDIPVTVTVNDAASTDITATLSASATNVNSLMALSDNSIVCFANEGSGNSSEATADAPHIYTLTINGLDGETLKNISISNKALTSGGEFQGSSVNRQRHYNVSYGTSTEDLTLIEDRIDLISVTGTDGSVERAKDFTVADVETGATLVIQLKMYNASDITGDEAEGCFYGLTGFTLTVTQEEPVEAPAAFAISKPLTAAELMTKTEPVYIAIKNLSFTNNRWFVGNTGTTPYSEEEFTNDAVFVWEPVTENTAGSYRLKKLNGDYMQTSAPKDFGTVDAAATFTVTNPTSAGTGSTEFNGDGDSNPYITGSDDANLVRFVKGDNWINVQNGTGGTPTYNTGKGGWTIHYVYELTETETYEASITDAGYATFYVPANVEIPDNVKAYYITSEGVNTDYVSMTEITTGVIPANTAVVLEGTEGNYTFNVAGSDATAVSGNLLKGTFTSMNIEGEAYVLSNPGEGVGLYKTEMTEIQLSNATGKKSLFLNNANKAYLPASAVPAAAQASNGFRFGEGTTGIEEVEIRNEKSETYDLTGRRIEVITTPGIYIINGVKKLVR